MSWNKLRSHHEWESTVEYTYNPREVIKFFEWWMANRSKEYIKATMSVQQVKHLQSFFLSLWDTQGLDINLWWTWKDKNGIDGDYGPKTHMTKNRVLNKYGIQWIRRILFRQVWGVAPTQDLLIQQWKSTTDDLETKRRLLIQEAEEDMIWLWMDESSIDKHLTQFESELESRISEESLRYSIAENVYSTNEVTHYSVLSIRRTYINYDQVIANLERSSRWRKWSWEIKNRANGIYTHLLTDPSQSHILDQKVREVCEAQWLEPSDEINQYEAKLLIRQQIEIEVLNEYASSNQSFRDFVERDEDLKNSVKVFLQSYSVYSWSIYIDTQDTQENLTQIMMQDSDTFKNLPLEKVPSIDYQFKFEKIDDTMSLERLVQLADLLEYNDIDIEVELRQDKSNEKEYIAEVYRALERYQYAIQTQFWMIPWKLPYLWSARVVENLLWWWSSIQAYDWDSIENTFNNFSAESLWYGYTSTVNYEGIELPFRVEWSTVTFQTPPHMQVDGVDAERSFEWVNINDLSSILKKHERSTIDLLQSSWRRDRVLEIIREECMATISKPIEKFLARKTLAMRKSILQNLNRQTVIGTLWTLWTLEKGDGTDRLLDDSQVLLLDICNDKMREGSLPFPLYSKLIKLLWNPKFQKNAKAMKWSMWHFLEKCWFIDQLSEVALSWMWKETLSKTINALSGVFISANQQTLSRRTKQFNEVFETEIPYTFKIYEWCIDVV